jgi:hypothetical protein
LIKVLSEARLALRIAFRLSNAQTSFARTVQLAPGALLIWVMATLVDRVACYDEELTPNNTHDFGV